MGDPPIAGRLTVVNLAVAEAILDRLRNVPPQYANAKTVAQYTEAVDLLADDHISAVWVQP